MAKNIVICCDGTGNEVSDDLTNVVKLYRIASKDAGQIVYYNPGVGTLGLESAWVYLLWQKAKHGFYQATGTGLDEKVLDAYRHLTRTYREGDRVFLFGFSRGAYTVRVLAGFLNLIGLLLPEQENLCAYAFKAYKKSEKEKDQKSARRFRAVVGTRRVPIRFMGVWDTVSSVLVPRLATFLGLLLFGFRYENLPYTRTNPSVETFRHAVSIDERRRSFRANLWRESPQPDLFDTPPVTKPDIRQVWFAGVHADIGGGYPEPESALAKIPLQWMIREAGAAGLHCDQRMFEHIVLNKGEGTGRPYTPPSCEGKIHNSMLPLWGYLELLPKYVWKEIREFKKNFLCFYFPLGERRFIREGSFIHQSVIDRMEKISEYRPANLPEKGEILKKYRIVTDTASGSTPSP